MIMKQSLILFVTLVVSNIFPSRSEEGFHHHGSNGYGHHDANNNYHHSPHGSGDHDYHHKVDEHGNHHGYHLHHHDMEAPLSKNTFYTEPPSPFDKAATARWLAHNTDWGAMATSTSSKRGERAGSPFANIASHSDGAPDASTGTLYFLHSSLDSSIIDVAESDQVSFVISEAQTGYCAQEKIDPEDPRCARLSMSGRLVKLNDMKEVEIAKTAMLSKHPAMERWLEMMGDPGNRHDFAFYKLNLEEIWLVDFYGGAAIIDKEAWDRGTDTEGEMVLPKSIVNDRTRSRLITGRNTTQVLFFFTTLLAAFIFGAFFGQRKVEKIEAVKRLIEEPLLEMVEGIMKKDTQASNSEAEENFAYKNVASHAIDNCDTRITIE